MTETRKLLIGHITDLHARHALHGSSSIPARRSRDAFELLHKAIDVLKTAGADFLVLTGDLVDVPKFILEPNDYYVMPSGEMPSGEMSSAEWLTLIESDYQQIKEILDSSGLPYMVLPGNHDYEPVMWQVFEKSTNIVDVEQGYRLVRFCDREWGGHIPRRFDRERRLWEQMLADEQSPPQIHLQHYVVTPALNEEYPHTYFEGENLEKRTVESERVHLSLSGHYHAGTELIENDKCYFAVGPAFCEAPHPFRLYELDDGKVTMQQFDLRNEQRYGGRKVVFLDRDGVINTLSSYNTGPEAMALTVDAGQAILKLREAGYAVVVITSQSCIGSGYVPQEIVHMNHERLCQLLVEETNNSDAQPDLILFSVGAGPKAVHPSLVDSSNAKPSPALLQFAENLLGFDPNDAWMVGDRLTDIQAAIAYGAAPILVRTGDGAKTEQGLEPNNAADLVICDNLAMAVEYILAQ